jgi:hypothetical protein
MKYPVAISLIILIAGVLMVPVVFSDDDRREYRQRSVGVAPVHSPMYQEECSSCHMAYPPGLLPARSWKKIMAGLETHFGDNAELDVESFKSISEFLVTNSADDSDYRRSRKIMRSLSSNDTPIRISETPYIKYKHDEIPDKLIKFNKKVNSLGNCSACHHQAEQGLYSEDGVNIPGYGRWDD